MEYIKQYNCNGTIETAQSMRDPIEKRTVLTPCNACTPSNTACQANCCPILTTNATFHCSCPVDRIGQFCETPRPYTCSLVPLDPGLACNQLSTSPLPASAASLPSCQNSVRSYPAVAGDTGTLSPFPYRLSCAFTIRPNINLMTYPAPASSISPTVPVPGPANLASWLRIDDTWAWSADGGPFSPAINHRVVNMYTLSDASLWQSIPVSQLALAGVVPVVANVNLSLAVTQTRKLIMNGKYYSKLVYLAGGRLYVEADLSRLGMTGLTGPLASTQGFVDFSDLPSWPFQSVRDSAILGKQASAARAGQTAGLVVMGVLIIIGAIFLIRRGMKPKAKAE
ncbi:hypothetical protein BC828DRAFT_389850 [Blastocladiella britannica]|nr:hypothetical protein BC828DRAFT_389850 [Blastocladiella britannica]